MSNSKLVDYTKISPHRSKRTGKISKITIHHMAGNLTVKTCGNVFQGKRAASANYGVDSAGRIGLYVPENYRAYTSSNRANDNIAVTIEVANDGGSKTKWHVSDKAIAALIELCVDICKRNGIKKLNYTGKKTGNLTRHNMFAATTCPGSYLQSKFPYIAEEVNKRLGAVTETEKAEEKEATKPIKLSVKEWQKAAIKDGFKFPKYGADGEWGNECEAVAKKAQVKKRSTYKYKNLTKLVQKVVGAEVDGKCGSETRAAIIAWQAKNGLAADGIIGYYSWCKMIKR